MEGFSKETEFNKEDNLLKPERRQQVMQELIFYIQSTQAMGGNDIEIEANNLLNRLQAGELVTEDYVSKVMGQLGNPEDKNTNYH